MCAVILRTCRFFPSYSVMSSHVVGMDFLTLIGGSRSAIGGGWSMMQTVHGSA